MSSSVTAVRDMNHFYQVVDNANGHGKLLVLEFMGKVSYRSTCEFMKPIFESIAANCKKNNVKADFCTVDVDNKEFKELAKDCGVQALPTFLMILDYDEEASIVAPNKEELDESIGKYAPKT
ncbi:thioredoxin H-type-like [Miscanthus floridulus]|uniref:thioredoxin H-type-like n=1 Tax=Miscanthus floridulus TaxID=154761 RepID=UPI00345B40EA